MMPAAHATSAARQAALAAHALDDEDQRWLLQALQPAHRALLLPLLDELKALGLPAEPACLEAALEQGRASTHPAASAPPAAAEQLVARLAAEPVALVDWVLRLQRWPWGDVLRSRVPAAGIAAPGGEAPARDAWLLQRLAMLTAPAPTPRASPLARWVQRWRDSRGAP